jgi:hypothetical protein
MTKQLYTTQGTGPAISIVRALRQAIIVANNQPSLNQLDHEVFIVRSYFLCNSTEFFILRGYFVSNKKGSLRDLNPILVRLAGTAIPDLRSFTT